MIFRIRNSKPITRNFPRGFTLLELLIYTLIFSGLVAGMVFLTRSIHDARARVRTSVVVQSDLRFAMTRIISYVRAADGITLPSTSTGSVLECSFASSSPALSPIHIEVANGVITVAKGGGAALPLTNSSVQVTGFSIDRSLATPTTIRVTISAKLRNGYGAAGSTLTLTEGAVIRRR